MPIRSPICAIEGHVDHGKTSILDAIRGTAVAKSEAGGITQAIGASIIPVSTIKDVCGDLLKKMGFNLTIPGLLFIDTPGHAAFSNLRKRGGNLADIAIVVIDINEGIMPQTKEAIEILKNYKTPFIVALNKIDLIKGFKKVEGPLLQKLNSQDPVTQGLFETKLYEVVGKLHEMGFESERFDRVSDFTKQVALVPLSAATKDGIPELLVVLAGLAQKYLESCLKCDVSGRAKGTILEVKEDKGLGKTIDVILYDGTLKLGDSIVIGSLGEPIITKVKALLQPTPLQEMRELKTKFNPVSEVIAATGVKISAPDIEEVIAGMPIQNCTKDSIEEVKQEVQKEIEEVVILTEKSGIIVKSDTLGSLEALNTLLKEKNIPLRKATIGKITKKDISEAESIYEEDPFKAVILGFNVKLDPELETSVKDSKVKIITNNIIYRLIEDFEKWQKEVQKQQEQKELEKIQKPFKIKILPGYIFRQSNPAICGIEVLHGTLTTNSQIMKKDGNQLAKIKSIEVDKENVEKLEKGKQAAVSIDGVTIGRQIIENDILYGFVSEQEFRRLKDLKKHLSNDEKELLKEIAEIMRKNNPVWGI